MKRTIFIISCIIITSIHSGSAQAPYWQWARSTQGPGDGFARSLALDTVGNVYVTGHFSGIVDFDPGPGVFNLNSAGGSGVFVLKLDSLGSFIWAIQFGGPGSGFSSSISYERTGSGAIYLTGYFTDTLDADPGSATYYLNALGLRDIFILKLDTSGNFIWAKSIGGTGWDEGKSITVSADSTLYLTGYFHGSVDFDPGPGTYFLTQSGACFIGKFSSSGNLIWAKTIGETGNADGWTIASDSSSNVYAAGQFWGNVDFDPDTLSTYFLSSADSAYADIFIIKLDSEGNFGWADRIGNLPDELVFSIAVDSLMNAYCTGAFEGTVDFNPDSNISYNLTAAGSRDAFIVKLDSSGGLAWAKSIGGPLPDGGSALSLDASGNVYTIGGFTGSVDFDPDSSISYTLSSIGSSDIFVSKLNSNGDFVWVKTAGGAYLEYGLTIQLDQNGKVYVAGSFESPSIAFDSTTLTTNPLLRKPFVAKLDTGIVTGMNHPGTIESLFAIYPNPFTSKVSIRCASGRSKGIQGVEIYNMLGVRVFNRFYDEPLTDLNLDLLQLKPGVYVLQIFSAEGSAVFKMLKP